LTKQYKGGYDRQSVLSAAGKLSCNNTALKRCTKTEMGLRAFRWVETPHKYDMVCCNIGTVQSSLHK